MEIKSKRVEMIVYKGGMKVSKSDKSKWYVYILQCKDGSLYTGVTNDLCARMEAHEAGRGSRYVRAKGFGRLLRFKECEDRSDACKKECFVKRLPASEKLNWFALR
jgi:putative endonuclease